MHSAADQTLIATSYDFQALTMESSVLWSSIVAEDSISLILKAAFKPSFKNYLYNKFKEPKHWW
jgi:uncharacterized protein YcfL